MLLLHFHTHIIFQAMLDHANMAECIKLPENPNITIIFFINTYLQISQNIS